MTPRKFTKKPATIQAWQYSTPKDAAAIVIWMKDNGERGARASMMMGTHATPVYQIVIPTLEGTMYARIGDWIIKGVKGEFYPCKPDIFEATYDEASES